RANFLPQALASIQSQTFTDWELIVVDDGSTDDTREVITRLAGGMSQQVQLIVQPNQGPYSARMTGIESAGGEFVACFDSDDIWLPHHLQECVAALRSNTDLGWVYGACRVVDYTSSRVLCPSSFYQDGKARAFLRLPSRLTGHLRVIETANLVENFLTHGLYCGLQASVIRKTVFADPLFRKRYQIRIGEDLILVLLALLTGCAFGYFDQIHTIYRVHQDNISTPVGSNAPFA